MMNGLSGKRKQEIIDAYFDYFNAYTKRQWDDMLNTFTKNLTMFGTGVDEVSLSYKQSINFFKREYLQLPTPLEFEIKEMDVFEISQDVAYIMILMDMRFIYPDEVLDCPDNRTTAIMKKEEDGWKLIHGHWSQPAEGQDEGTSIPYKLLKEKNKQLEEKVRERTIEIEKQNEELQRLNDTKTNLLSIISHDLRSPFNAFLGLTEVMLMNFNDNIGNPDYFKERLQLINNRAKGLYSVADNLLNWAWTQTDEICVDFKNVRLESIVRNQLDALAENASAKSINIKVDVPSDLVVKTDSEILAIIIRNFISNAIKYSYREGEVVISAVQKDNGVTLIVKDRGIGIDAKKLDRIKDFKEITSRPGTEQEKGTGLGLIICKELVEKIKGEFSVESTEKKGTSIALVLPLGG
ncbi:MAG: ATP-binding protein [Bacteroidales bacterium]